MVLQLRIMVSLRSKKEVAVGRGMRGVPDAGTLLFLELGGGTWVWGFLQ